MWLKQLKITWKLNKKTHTHTHTHTEQQQQHYIWKNIITFYAQKKKNTNAIHNLIHTHTHTHIYISSLLTYIMRELLLNYLLTMLTLKGI